VCQLLLGIYHDLGFDNVIMKLADRPPKRVGSDDVWDRAETALASAMNTLKLPYTLNKGEGAFYGPKIEFVLRDAIGRDWQCGTLQVDLNMPALLGATYIGEDGNRHTPVMLHRAIFGSLERFIGILLENYAGALPFWLAPLQIVVATITSDADDYAREVVAELRLAGLRAEADLRNEKINYKVREHSLAKVPVILAAGKREVAERSVALRRFGSQNQTSLALAAAVEQLRTEAAVRGASH
jgi:threonyl-tRNA synthetase